MIRFRIYQDNAGGWRWRLLAANNYIVADSGESYTSRNGAVQAAEWVRDNARFGTIA